MQWQHEQPFRRRIPSELPIRARGQPRKARQVDGLGRLRSGAGGLAGEVRRLEGRQAVVRSAQDVQGPDSAEVLQPQRRGAGVPPERLAPVHALHRLRVRRQYAGRQDRLEVQGGAHPLRRDGQAVLPVSLVSGGGGPRGPRGLHRRTPRSPRRPGRGTRARGTPGSRPTAFPTDGAGTSSGARTGTPNGRGSGTGRATAARAASRRTRAPSWRSPAPRRPPTSATAR